jgi:hypothetical protein
MNLLVPECQLPAKTKVTIEFPETDNARSTVPDLE